MATKDHLNIAENIEFGKERDEVNHILTNRIAYLNEELERTKSQSKTNPESLTKLAHLYEELENLRSQMKNDKVKITNTSNKLSYLFFFTAFVASIAAVIAFLF